MGLIFSSHGILNKVQINNEIFKDSLYKYTREPIAEVICSKLLDIIELPHTRYTLALLPDNSGFISDYCCKCHFVSGIIEVYKLMNTPDEYEILDLIDRQELIDLFVFDSLVSNPDRHLGNIHLKNNHIIILDNGQALDAMNNFESSETTWQSNPLEPFHDDQLRLLKCTIKDTFLNRINIIDAINDIFASKDLTLIQMLLTERQITNIKQLLLTNYNKILEVLK